MQVTKALSTWILARCCTCGQLIRKGDRIIVSDTGKKAAHHSCGMMHSEE